MSAAGAAKEAEAAGGIESKAAVGDEDKSVLKHRKPPTAAAAPAFDAPTSFAMCVDDAKSVNVHSSLFASGPARGAFRPRERWTRAISTSSECRNARRRTPFWGSVRAVV